MISKKAAVESQRIKPKRPSNMINAITFFSVCILISYVDGFSSTGGVGTRSASYSSLFNTNGLFNEISPERNIATVMNGRRRKNTQMHMFRRKQNCNDNIRGANGAVRKWVSIFKIRMGQSSFETIKICFSIYHNTKSSMFFFINREKVFD